MKTTLAHPKKSPASKAHKVGTVRCAVPVAERSVRRRNKNARDARATTSVPPAKSGKARAGTSQRNVPTIQLPTALERDTLLTPEWVAEYVVQEVERFLQAELPENFADRLAAKAHYLYPRHKHFHKGLNRPGWRGRENLLMFMRHWTAGWLKRERNPLHKKLPYSFGMGRRLPS